MNGGGGGGGGGGGDLMGLGVNAKRSRATLSCDRDGAAPLPPVDGEVGVPAALRYVWTLHRRVPV